MLRRSDGRLVRRESNVRKMMPYLMRGRNESAVFHEQHYDLTKTRPWLDAWNRAHREFPATLFHLLVYAFGRVFHERPGLNRFVSGGRIYQREHVELSFAAKQRMDARAPLVDLKLRIPRDEAFVAFVPRIATTIADARTRPRNELEIVSRLLLALPRPVVRGAVGLLKALDSANLLPSALIERDPKFATAMIGNLGSLDLDRTFHHLDERGTASFFGAIGAARPSMVVGRDGRPAVCDSVRVRWTFDERINDGFYCASALKIPKQIVEDPAIHIE